MKTMRVVVVASWLDWVAGHASITLPAIRDNTKLGCAWCQGSASACQDVEQCAPADPCGGADAANTIPASQYNSMANLKHPDGTYWVDQTGGQSSHQKPFWCPGSVQKMRMYLYADHNGVFRFESQLSEAGQETEADFKNFTPWQSINVHPETKYFKDDGMTPILGNNCTTAGREGPWTAQIPHCRDLVFAEFPVKIPHNMEAGETVVRWLWYGAMTLDESYVYGPEHSLFLNCMDVEVGTPEQCGCTGGTLNSCKQACASDTGTWDGSFDKFIGNSDFCSHCGQFGVADCSFICAGGDDGGSGAGCQQSACDSGQYSFHEDGWHISVTAAQAGGKAPYRAFAYLPFCNGQQVSQCVQEPFTFAISFRTDDMSGWGAYVKFLFWTDSGNIIGLLPPGSSAAKGNSSFRLLAFPQDDLPNTWLGEMVIVDGQWYDARITFNGGGSVTLSVGDFSVTNPNFGVNIGGDGNGPQLGVYSFDYGGERTSDQFKLTIGSIEGPAGTDDHHACEESCLVSCDSGVDPVPTPPTPPTPPAPTPGKGPGNCCWGAPGDTCATVGDCHLDAYCGASEDVCTNCAGMWCPVDPEPTPSPVPTPVPPSPVPPTPVPSPVPPTPVPSPVPGDCPGGSLDACMDLCPADVSPDAFKDCIHSCEDRCPSAMTLI